MSDIKENPADACGNLGIKEVLGKIYLHGKYHKQILADTVFDAAWN